MKAFVVLSQEFQTKEQKEMTENLQDHVTRSSAAWMSPSKVGCSLRGFLSLPSEKKMGEGGGGGFGCN